jgi:hypothetical protein
VNAIPEVTPGQIQARMTAVSWRPRTGQAHILVLGANGHGKTGLTTRLIFPMLHAERALSIDVKGDDDMLSGYGAPVSAVVPGMAGDGDGPGGSWWRLVIDPLNDRAGAVRATRRALHVARNEGHMILNVDETRAVTDADPQLGLRAELEEALLRGRSRYLRAIGSAQSVEYMAPSMRNQWAVAFIGALRDDNAIERALRLAGLWHAKSLYMPAVRDMPPRTWLYVDRAEGRPAIGIVTV